MQQRIAASGRPSGTDGSDHTHRMLINTRYTTVAEAKDRLRSLISAQVFIQVLGILWATLLSQEKGGLDALPLYSVVIGSFSIVAGELGRKWSYVSLLKLYVAGLSVATLMLVASVVRGDLSVQVIKNQNSAVLKKFEFIEIGRVLISVPLHIYAFITTVSLVQNMSPNRAS